MGESVVFISRSSCFSESPRTYKYLILKETVSLWWILEVLQVRDFSQGLFPTKYEVESNMQKLSRRIKERVDLRKKMLISTIRGDKINIQFMQYKASCSIVSDFGAPSMDSSPPGPPCPQDFLWQEYWEWVAILSIKDILLLISQKE